MNIHVKMPKLYIDKKTSRHDILRKFIVVFKATIKFSHVKNSGLHSDSNPQPSACWADLLPIIPKRAHLSLGNNTFLLLFSLTSPSSQTLTIVRLTRGELHLDLEILIFRQTDRSN